MDRRAFLKASSGLALGSLAFAGVGCATDTDSSSSSAAAPDTTMRGGTRTLSAIGVQLYTVRSLMEDDFEGTLRQVADIGYREVEFAGYYGRSPDEVRGLLDELGLSAPAMHVPLNMLRGDLDSILQTAQAIGHEYVVCPWLPEAQRTMGFYRELPSILNAIGQQCRDAGLQFGYHNHDFEFASMDGTVPYNLLLQETDPQLVGMELDLYWIRAAGYDPLTYFADYAGRFPLCHVKDRTADGEITAVGQGEIDFAAIFAQSEQAGLQHYFVEHDNPADPLASIQTSYAYLSQLEF